jgi:hypothetical protein
LKELILRWTFANRKRSVAAFEGEGSTSAMTPLSMTGRWCVLSISLLLACASRLPNADAGPSAASKPQYSYLPVRTPHVAKVYIGYMQGGKFVPATVQLFLGNIDESGNFVPYSKELQESCLRPVSGYPVHIINKPLVEKETVYEYRSGMLILGYLNEAWQFVPKPGSQVIEFRDYEYAEDAIRIYNLPGQFERVQK